MSRTISTPQGILVIPGGDPPFNPCDQSPPVVTCIICKKTVNAGDEGMPVTSLRNVHKGACFVKAAFYHGMVRPAEKGSPKKMTGEFTVEVDKVEVLHQGFFSDAPDPCPAHYTGDSSLGCTCK